MIRDTVLGYSGGLAAMASPYMGAQLALALSAFAGRCTYVRVHLWERASSMQEMFRDAMSL